MYVKDAVISRLDKLRLCKGLAMRDSGQQQDTCCSRDVPGNISGS